MISNPAKDLMEQGLEDLECNIGSPKLTWLGIEYPCVNSSLKRGTTIDWGGQLVDIQFTKIVRKRLLVGAARPIVTGCTIFDEGIEYRVVKTSAPAQGASLHLDLADINR